MRSRNKRALVAFVLLCRAVPAAWAEGTTAAEFLRMGIGAPAYLSDASGSVARGAQATYWNPAGVAGTGRSEIYISHHSLPETVNSDFASAAMPLKGGSWGTLAMMAQVLSQGTLTKLDNTGAAVGSFTAGDMAASLVWAKAWGANRFGVGAKLVQQSIAEFSGMSPAFDVGFQHDWGDWSFGAAFANMGPALKLRSESYPLPLIARGGVSRKSGPYMMAADVESFDGQTTLLHIGETLQPFEFLSLGVGYTVGENSSGGVSGFTGGGSLHFGDFTADFGYKPFGKLGAELDLGLGMRFGRGGKA